MKDQLEVIHQYIEAFNKGDTQKMEAAFSESGTILDGMPPHVWQGTTAARDWYRDVMDESEKHHASDYAVTIGEPRHNEVSGDNAYVVLPATMAFKMSGNPVVQTGAFFTVALRKYTEGWRIMAWAWTKGMRQTS